MFYQDVNSERQILLFTDNTYRLIGLQLLKKSIAKYSFEIKINK